MDWPGVEAEAVPLEKSCGNTKMGPPAADPDLSGVAGVAEEVEPDDPEAGEDSSELGTAAELLLRLVKRKARRELILGPGFTSSGAER